MFKVMLRSLLTPNVVKSLLRHVIVAAGTGMGIQAVMHGQDVAALADSIFVIGSTLWGWYDAHQRNKETVIADYLRAKLRPSCTPLSPEDESAITRSLNLYQAKRGSP